jgi:hypothetical protein
MNQPKQVLTATAGLVAVVFSLAACTTAPQGPSVRVMPAPGKPFDVFVSEDNYCRAYAAQSSGANGPDASGQAAVNSAVVGTALGAAAGALIGGNSRGASTGAGIGLLMGAANGSGQAEHGAYSAQRRFDIAYEQCMYAKGNLVPGQALPHHAAPPPANLPPPPPPPPPPGQ